MHKNKKPIILLLTVTSIIILVSAAEHYLVDEYNLQYIIERSIAWSFVLFLFLRSFFEIKSINKVQIYFNLALLSISVSIIIHLFFIITVWPANRFASIFLFFVNVTFFYTWYYIEIRDIKIPLSLIKKN